MVQTGGQIDVVMTRCSNSSVSRLSANLAKPSAENDRRGDVEVLCKFTQEMQQDLQRLTGDLWSSVQSRLVDKVECHGQLLRCRPRG